ncbi:MAG TPA: DUF3160 domain-containing protein [Polyangiaceae bacterium]
MDLIQKSTLALSDKELAILAKRGFVVSSAHAFPTFAYGYISIYGADLPLYISADSILNAVQESYDSILADIESRWLASDLGDVLSGMQSGLAAADFSSDLRAGTDVYLTTARSLLGGKLIAPVDPKNAAAVSSLFALATAASGTSSVTVFGLKRIVDFSQFKPRGHYEGDALREQYFRALIWLGRMDARARRLMSDLLRRTTSTSPTVTSASPIPSGPTFCRAARRRGRPGFRMRSCHERVSHWSGYRRQKPVSTRVASVFLGA